MAITSTYAFTVTNTGGNAQRSATITTSLTDASAIELATTVAVSTSNTYSWAIDVSQVKHLYVETSSALTLLVNDDGTPDVTLTLSSAAPIVWTSGMGTACPLGSVDATSVKFTNGSSTVTADLYFFCVVDPA